MRLNSNSRSRVARRVPSRFTTRSCASCCCSVRFPRQLSAPEHDRPWHRSLQSVHPKPPIRLLTYLRAVPVPLGIQHPAARVSVAFAPLSSKKPETTLKRRQSLVLPPPASAGLILLLEHSYCPPWGSSSASNCSVCRTFIIYLYPNLTLCLDFKSYKGHHTLLFGDSYFTSIIGPNGSGKSNS